MTNVCKSHVMHVLHVSSLGERGDDDIGPRWDTSPVFMFLDVLSEYLILLDALIPTVILDYLDYQDVSDVSRISVSFEKGSMRRVISSFHYSFITRSLLVLSCKFSAHLCAPRLITRKLVITRRTSNLITRDYQNLP